MLLWYQTAPKHHHPYYQFTNLPANKQGSALVLSLEDEALDDVLEIDDEDIAKENLVWML